MTLRPFNLEEAKAGKAVCNSVGEVIVDFKAFDTINKTPLVVLHKDHTIQYHYADGKNAGLGRRAEYDLFMAPEKKTVWINIYPIGGTSQSGTHASRADADAAADRTRIACIEVTYTEGEGLS